MAKQVMDALIAEGVVHRGDLGLSFRDPDENEAESPGFKGLGGGVLVTETVPGGPAAGGGIRAGDIIVTFQGRRVLEATSLRIMVAETKPKNAVRIGLLRAGMSFAAEVVTGVLAPRPAADSPEKRLGSKQRLH